VQPCPQPDGQPLLIIVEYAKYGNLKDFLKSRYRIYKTDITSNNAKIPSHIWSVSKEPIAIFEFTTWHASFTDFFMKL
jgi:hypothetical protein